MLMAHKFSARKYVWINRSYIKLIRALTQMHEDIPGVRDHSWVP